MEQKFFSFAGTLILIQYDAPEYARKLGGTAK